MAANREDLSRWFDEGLNRKATHMIVVCDSFDYEDYPVFVSPDQDVKEVMKTYDGHNMQRIMEVYSFALSKTSQMQEHRAWHQND